MLQLIVHILVISVTCILWGLPLLFFLRNKINSSIFWLAGTAGFYSFLFFAGLITVSFISSWLCLVLPLKFIYLLILTLPLLLFLFVKRDFIFERFRSYPVRFNFSFIEVVFIIICLLIFLVSGTLQPANTDTQIYHVQIIRWFNEYGAVPGIANLFPRYGLGSNWFNLISIFRLPFPGNENFTWLNTTIVIWFFVWLLNKWKFHNSNAITKESTIMCHFYLLLILYSLFEWELFRDAANSTNYDFVVTALTLMSICFLLESILFSNTKTEFSFFYIVLSVSIIPFKLSGIFILLPLFFYLLQIKKIKYWVLSAVTGILIIIPFLIKNYIVTGYPLYPAVWTIGQPDWQVPPAMTDYLRQYIYVVNRHYNSNSVDFSKLPELMNEKWFSSWINGLLFQQKFILILSLGSLSLFFFKKKLAIDHKKLRLLLITLFLMAAGWFFTAPSPRFGYGVLLVLAFFPACFYAGPLLILSLHKPIIILTFFIAGYYLYEKAQPIIQYPHYFIYPQKLDQPPLNTIQIKGMDFYLPEIINKGWMRNCFNTQLPCICNENKYLQPRGKTLKQGFKMDPQPDSIFIRKYIY